MERFGIFELLDALSALPREGADQRAEAGQESPAKEERLWRAAPPEGGAARSGDTEKAPFPDGGTAHGREGSASPALSAQTPPSPRSPEEGSSPRSPENGSAPSDGRDALPSPAPKALESFLKRHDALSKKAEKH